MKKCDRCEKPATKSPCVEVDDMPMDLYPDLCDEHYHAAGFKDEDCH